jgi:hypothetical protein
VQVPNPEPHAKRPCARDIRADHRADQPERGAIGQLHRLVVAFIGTDDRHGTEDFLLEGAHARAHARQDGGREHRAPGRAADVQPCAPGDRVIDDALDPGRLALGDQGPQGTVFPRRVPDRQMRGLGRQHLGQAVRHRGGREDKTGRHADLPLVQPAAPGRVRGRQLEVGILHHDQGVLATEFELNLLESATAGLAHPGADFGRPGKGHHRDIRVLAKGGAHIRPARNDVQQPFGQTRLFEGARDHHAAGNRGPRVRLVHHGVARGERGGDGPDRQDQRKVEGRDDADDAVGHADQLFFRVPAVDRGQGHGAGLERRVGGGAQEAGTVLDLDPRFRRDRTALADDPGDQFLGIGLEDIGGAVQDLGAPGGSGRFPSGLPGGRAGSGPGEVIGAGPADLCDLRSVGWCRDGFDPGGARRPFPDINLSAPDSLVQKRHLVAVHRFSSLCPVTRSSRSPAMKVVVDSRGGMGRECCGRRKNYINILIQINKISCPAHSAM